MKTPTWILPTIVLAQFCCTSLWFAGNGVMDDLVMAFGLDHSAIGHLTSAVQFGFIAGTLLFAMLTIADRYSPSKVFLYAALAGAGCNLGMIWGGNQIESLLIFRFLTGFFLAGIYPVGMKIAADYFDKGLGKSLGYLVGALVLGTATPHLLKASAEFLSWKTVAVVTSTLAVSGGLMIRMLVPDGPFRKPGQRPDMTAFFRIFRQPALRAAAFGYFGHMWELYAFWAFVPVILAWHQSLHPELAINIHLFSFMIIASGGMACVLGGYVSTSLGTKRTASIALSLSGLCCLISPWVFNHASATSMISFLVFWGMAVVADSPLFSTLVATHAEGAIKGTALTIVNCLGFSITIISIQLLNYIKDIMNPANIFIFLAIGPALGLLALYSKGRKDRQMIFRIF